MKETQTTHHCFVEMFQTKKNKQTFKMAEMTDSLKIVEEIKFKFLLLKHFRKSRIILEYKF
jgi:hypothetical protein